MSHFLVVSVMMLAGTQSALAQGISAPGSTVAVGWTPSNRQASEEAGPSTNAIVRLTGGEATLGGRSLSNDAGQVWQEYDISEFTRLDAAASHPEQAIVDWILRETGTDLWFREPLGLLSARRETIRVYHTSEVHTQVSAMIDRFVNPEAGKQAFCVKMVTIANPNWRARAMGRLAPVQVQTPGVEAWLMSREDAAVVYDELRKRTDFREYSSPNLLVRNGQTHDIQRFHPVAYVKAIRAVPAAPGGYQLEMGQVEEGFSLALSPLLSRDRQIVDAVVRFETTQIEKLNNISVPTPTTTNPKQLSQVQVPQTSSWRLHERFHWPAEQVLLISCGVVATPTNDRSGALNLNNLNVAARPQRADALLMVEAKGKFSNLVAAPQVPTANGEISFRGRY